MVDNRIFEGQQYDYDFMMEVIKKYPGAKKMLEQDREELRLAEQNLQSTRDDLENTELEWSNLVGEWEGFKPFEDAVGGLGK